MSEVTIFVGDCRHVLQELKDQSVQCCVTSPPRWSRGSDLPDGHPDRLRDLGVVASPYSYVTEIVQVFRSVRRVLKNDGTVWLHLQDVYRPTGLCGIRGLFGLPSRVAIGLQADGWSLQADLAVARSKPSFDPEAGWPVAPQSRVLVLSKSERYRCDVAPLSEPMTETEWAASCLRAGSWRGDAVLDPFGGNGMTAHTAQRWDRNAVICELNPERAEHLRASIYPIGKAV